MTTTRSTCLAAAEAFAGAVREFGTDRIAAARRLPPELAALARDLGLFRLLVPTEFNGPETPPGDLVRALERIAREDASASWVVMIAATTSVMAAYYPDDVSRAVFGRDDAMVCGVAAPLGRATRDGDAFRVSGSWPFGSGCQCATAMVGGCLVLDGGEPARLPSGEPESRLFLFDIADVELLDTWYVSGLQGTGSHDFRVRDLHLPAARSTVLGVDRPRIDRPLYTFPIWGLLALGVASVALGLGRAAIDALIELAGGKVPIGSQRRLAERPGAQAEVAKAEAILRSARAFLLESLDSVWDRVSAGGRMGIEERALLRLACTHAATASAAVVEAMFLTAGSSSNYERSPLQRQSRDIHALLGHVMVQPTTWEMAGRIFLGLPPNTPML